jgi:CDP-diacylglycerol--glycerol-3-phosphate 3-phosphatidyltransferase
MTQETANAVRRLTFTDRMRVRFKNVLDLVGGFFNRLGLHPNTMTLLGLIGTVGGSVLLAFGQMRLGGLLVLLMGPVDALDGTMARLRGEPSRFGAFVDSVTDRWAELLILGGLLVHYTLGADRWGILLTYAAAVGSVMVSYVKARAEALQFDCNVGLLTRMERYLVLAPALLLNVPLAGVAILAVLGNFTALQRIWHVRVQARRR